MAVGALQGKSTEIETFTEETLTEVQFFGTVTSSNNVHVVSEDSNAGLYTTVDLPVGAQELRFRYRFLTAGDGDFLTVHGNERSSLSWA